MNLGKNTTLKVFASIAALSGVAAVGAFAVYKQIHAKTLQIIQQKAEIADAILIKFLRDLKSQSFPHFFLVAGIVKALKADSESEDVFQSVFDQIFVEIKSLFEAKQKVVIGKYPFTSQEFELAIQASTNPRVITLREEFERLYTNCLQGIDPEILLHPSTINKFNEAEVLKVVKDVLDCSMTIIYSICRELHQNKGPGVAISLHMPEFIKLIHQLGLVEAKREVLVGHDILRFEPELDELQEPSSPTEVFSKVTHHHKLSNPAFKLRIDQIEKQYETLIGRFMKEQISEEEARKLIEDVKNFVAQN